MSEQNLSQWFDLAEQRPWEIGTYEVETQRGTIGYSYWCGVRFNWVTQDKSGSKEYFDTGYTHGLGKVVIKWRGLSTNPEVKKNQQNKRKTVYRVYSMSRFDFQYILIACFDSRKKAEAFIDHRQKLDELMRFNIQPLRFRTPE